MSRFEKVLSFVLFLFFVCYIAFAGYSMGSHDHTNEIACSRAMREYYQKEIQFYYDKWRAEELDHIHTQRDLERAQRQIRALMKKTKP